MTRVDKTRWCYWTTGIRTVNARNALCFEKQSTSNSAETEKMYQQVRIRWRRKKVLHWIFNKRASNEDVIKKLVYSRRSLMLNEAVEFWIERSINSEPRTVGGCISWRSFSDVILLSSHRFGASLSFISPFFYSFCSWNFLSGVNSKNTLRSLPLDFATFLL